MEAQDGMFNEKLGLWIALKKHETLIAEKQKDTRKRMADVEKELMEIITLNGWDTAVISADSNRISVSVKEEKTKTPLSERTIKSAISSYIEMRGGVIDNVDELMKSIVGSRSVSVKRKLSIQEQCPRAEDLMRSTP